MDRGLWHCTGGREQDHPKRIKKKCTKKDFLPRSKHFLISWLQSPSAVILEPKKSSQPLFPLFPHLFLLPASKCKPWLIQQVFWAGAVRSILDFSLGGEGGDSFFLRGCLVGWMGDRASKGPLQLLWERVHLKNETKEWQAQESNTGLMHSLSSWMLSCLKPGPPSLWEQISFLPGVVFFFFFLLCWTSFAFLI